MSKATKQTYRPGHHVAISAPARNSIMSAFPTAAGMDALYHPGIVRSHSGSIAGHDGARYGVSFGDLRHPVTGSTLFWLDVDDLMLDHIDIDGQRYDAVCAMTPGAGYTSEAGSLANRHRYVLDLSGKLYRVDGSTTHWLVDGERIAVVAVGPKRPTTRYLPLPVTIMRRIDNV